MEMQKVTNTFLLFGGKRMLLNLIDLYKNKCKKAPPTKAKTSNTGDTSIACEA
jgi:hypothetical protein